MSLSKPRPILLDMPPHIKGRIARNLSKFDKMTLRSCHPEFRRIIGNPKIKFHFLFLHFYYAPNPKVTVEARNGPETDWIDYESVAGGTEITRRRIRKEEDRYKKTVVFVPEKHGNFIDLMAEAFGCLVGNPNFRISGFSVDCNSHRLPPKDSDNGQEFLSKIGRVLSQLKHKVKAKQLWIHVKRQKQENLLNILPYVDTSRLRIQNFNNDGFIDGVDKLIDHWKHVDDFSMFDIRGNKFPIEQWWDFPVIRMQLKHTSLEDIQRLVQHFRRSETFVSCFLETNFRQEQLKDALGETDVLVPHPSRLELYMEFPATETLKRVFVRFFLEDVRITTQLENENRREASSDED